MKKRIGIQGFLIFLSVLALGLFWRYIFAVDRPIIFDLILSLLGITLVLCGYSLRIAARGFKAQENPDGKTLVTTGPYLLTRNPMYLGTLCIGLGVTIALFRWWVILIFLAVYLMIYIPQIDREEKVLAQRFSERFEWYCQKVPKFFPDLNMVLSTSPKQYCLIKSGWLKKELPSLIYTFIFIIFLKLWFYLK
ncbi:MAG: isoprenylcysteine carboxylmethyltransferase family protein [Candidatus Omnitrophica bacterium]|nr:isoprenylcysteine carboxylmethyltransferase family protein [Candidatus Omnitrophota bacterium]